MIASMTDRQTWTPTDVVDVSGPSALLRNYLEQRDVRGYLAQIARRTPIRRAYDVGCGFGRLTPVLAEFAAEAVVGYEREESLVATARQLLPSLRFERVATLEQLPSADASADVVLVFTVVQHMPDLQAAAVLREIARVLTPGGHLLLCEETDSSLEAGDVANADLGYTRGRRVEWYAANFGPSKLHGTSRRVIEPGYPRPDVGTYMLFERLRA